MTRDRLRAERVLRSEAGARRRVPDLARGDAEARGGDERHVELADRHRPVRVVVADRHREGPEHGPELAPSERVVRAEALDAHSEQPGVDDGLDLRGGPRARRARARVGGARREREGDERAHEDDSPHAVRIGNASCRSTLGARAIRAAGHMSATAENRYADSLTGSWLAERLAIDPLKIEAMRRAGELIAVREPGSGDWHYPPGSSSRGSRGAASAASSRPRARRGSTRRACTTS